MDAATFRFMERRPNLMRRHHLSQFPEALIFQTLKWRQNSIPNNPAGLKEFPLRDRHSKRRLETGGHKRSLPSILTRILLAGLFLELVYVVAANFYLHSQSFHSILNGRPDHFYIRWNELRTWWPGEFRAAGIAFVGQGTHDVYSGTLDQCRFAVSFTDLLRHRIRCTHLRATGVDFRLTTPNAARGRPSESEIGFPEIEGIQSIPTRQDSHRTPDQFDWPISVVGIEWTNIHSVWIRSMHLQGRSSLHGEMERQPDGTLFVKWAPYVVHSGTVEYRGRPAMTNLSIYGTGSLGPVDTDKDQAHEVLDSINSVIESEGLIQDLEPLQTRVGSSGETMLRGVASYRTRLDIHQGRYLPGSQLNLDSQSMELQLGRWRWIGRFHLEDEVTSKDQGPVALLQSRWTALQWLEEGHDPVPLVGAEVAMDSSARELRLVDRFKDANLKLKLSNFQFPQPRFLNAYVPEGTGVQFESGLLHAEASIHRDANHHFEGGIDIHGQGLQAQTSLRPYILDLDFHSRFESNKDETNRFRIPEARLSFTNIYSPSASKKATAERGFISLQLTQGTVQPLPSWRLDTPLQIRMQDSSPILEALRSQPKPPSWLSWVPHIRDVSGTLELEATEKRLELRQISIQGRGTEIRAEITHQDQRWSGLVYARLGLLAIGFDFRGLEHYWTVLGAKHWYQSAHASWQRQQDKLSSNVRF